MASFNKVILMGNLTRDPELRYTPGGTAVAKLGLAVNRHWTAENGEKKEEVTFVDVDVFGRTAENCGQYLQKGRPLMVEGRLRLSQWEDKQSGGKRSKLGVVAETVQFLGGRQEGDAPRPSPAKTGAVDDADDAVAKKKFNQPGGDEQAPESDDVPF